ncbi:sigma-70 family RNA polymerase sigma factor [Actinoplanes sp. CA-015351]|uniref:sigma-70 family RNA polymerase sigma factor n=1 Tax=Actinoplanes sp. CA-015351 TaxID=3239897 RepID=UPI003D956214
MSERDDLATAFEQHRTRLVTVAHRILGSRADAEDAVQEAWLRLARQDTGTIDNLGGWLTTVTGRICVDMLRSKKIKPEIPYGDQPPDLVVIEDDALLADAVGQALLVVLDTLRPAERLAFVLHDMFAVPFDEIGQILGRSADATKMLASRARRKVQGTPHPEGERRRQRAVVDAFLAAARGGDFDGLLRILDPDVTWRTWTARGLVVRHGAAEIAARAQQGVRAQVTAHSARVNGEPGYVVRALNGKLLAVMACTVSGDRIVEMLSVSDPAHLATVTVTSAPPAPSS